MSALIEAPSILPEVQRAGVKSWQADLFAVVATAATLALRMALDGQFEGQPTLVIFAVPIMLSAYVGGMRAGLLATALSVLGACYYILPPLHSLAIASTRHRWDELLVAFAGVTISVLNGALHGARQRAEAAIRKYQRADAALRSSEASMAVAQRIGNIGSWELDLANTSDVDANPLRWSDEMFRIAGYEPGEIEVSNELFFSLIPEREHQPIRDAVAAAVHGRERYSFVHHLVRPDGEVRFVQEEGKIFFASETGLPEKIVGTARDITDERRVEDRVRMQANMLNHIGQAVLATDLSGTVIYANRVAENLYGWPLAELLGRNVVELTATPASQEQGRQIMERLQRGECWSGEFLVRRRNGTAFPAFVTDAPICDHEGKLIGIIGISEDITERHLALEYLQLAAAEQRGLIRQLEIEKARLLTAQQVGKVGSWETDLETYVVTWSEETHRIFESRPGDFQPTHERFLAFVHSADREAVASAFAGSLLLRSPSTIDHRIALPSGRVKTVTERWQTQFSETGEPLCVLGTCQDITERKEIERELRHSQRNLLALNTGLEMQVARRTQQFAAATAEAMRANHAKSEFLSRMSHELRTPMNAILGFAQVLETDESLSSDQSESVGEILRGGRHLLDLIDEVLDLSTIEAGRLKLSPEAVALPPLLRETSSLLRPLLAASGIRLTLLCDGPDWHMHADRQRLKQVLLNLVGNAIKYNRPGGTVTVRYAARNVGTCDGPRGMIRLEVSDTGPGISAVNLERLFTPFERLGAEQTLVKGTGLGLLVARRMVEQMGGTLGVESVVGEGSTFWFQLPSAEAPMELEEPPEECATVVAAESPEETQVVLYIEDNRSNTRLITRILARRPAIQLLCAETGASGLDLAREHRPGLILLDLHLPDCHGTEMLTRLAAEPRTAGIPVVMLTADAMPQVRDQLLAAGARAVITKPVDVRAFLGAIDRLLAAEPAPDEQGLRADGEDAEEVESVAALGHVGGW